MTDTLALLVALVALLSGLAIGKAWERYKLQDGRWIDRRKIRESPHYILGLNFLASNQIDLAIEELTKAMGLDSTALEINLILGNLYRERGQVSKAIRLHQRLLQRPKLSTMEQAYVQLCLGLDYKRGGFVDRLVWLGGRRGDLLNRSGRGFDGLIVGPGRRCGVSGRAGLLVAPVEVELQEVLHVADHIDLLARLVPGTPQVAQQVVGAVRWQAVGQVVGLGGCLQPAVPIRAQRQPVGDLHDLAADEQGGHPQAQGRRHHRGPHRLRRRLVVTGVRERRPDLAHRPAQPSQPAAHSLDHEAQPPPGPPEPAPLDHSGRLLLLAAHQNWK